jgi:hypothetical protein
MTHALLQVAYSAFAGPNPYCKPDWVNFTAQLGVAVPSVTLHCCEFTDPGASVLF